MTQIAIITGGASGIGGEPDELQLVHWDTIIDTNLRGVIHGCHANRGPALLRTGG